MWAIFSKQMLSFLTISTLLTKQSPFFDFSALYVKIPLDKLIRVLSDQIDVCLKDLDKKSVLVYISGAEKDNQIFIR